MNFNTDKRNLGSCFKPSLLMLSLSLLGLAGSCQSGTPTTVDIDLGNTGFFQDSNPDTTERTYSFFAGTNNDSFTLNLQPTGLSATSRIIALAGDGSTVTTITSPAATSVTFPGNVGFLRLTSDGLGPSLGMTISTVTLNADGNLGNSPPPSNTPTLANKVWSMPLALNSPLELFLASSGGPAYFVTVQGVAGRTVDIMLDGPGGLGQTGTVIINTEPGSWSLDTNNAEDLLTSLNAGFRSITMPADKDTLFLTVQSSGFGGHAIFSVNAPAQVITVQARHWSATALNATQVAAITAVFTRANEDLYRVTAGRVRMGQLNLYTAIAAGGNPTVDDIILVPPSVVGSISVALPAGKTALHMNPSPGPPISAVQLAQAILNRRLGLPVERSDADNTDLCPNSFMSNLNMIQPALCWRRNHNPFGSNGLGAIAPTSAWETLAPRVGAPEMTTSPPRLLRNVTTVTIPLAVSINP